MIDLKAAKEVIYSSSQKGIDECLESLREGMNSLGHCFEKSGLGQHQAYDKAIKYWGNIREKEVPLERFYSLQNASLISLPGTRLELGGKVYFMHGILHGDISDNDSILLKRKLSDYNQPSNGKCLFLEDGLGEWSGIDVGSYESFGDSVLFEDIGKEGVKTSLAMERSDTGGMNQIMQALSKDFRLFPAALEISKRMRYLPEPLFMAYKKCDPVAEVIMEKRSEYMADSMFESGAKEVHAVVGMAHEPQIEYFLKKMHGD